MAEGDDSEPTAEPTAKPAVRAARKTSLEGAMMVVRVIQGPAAGASTMLDERSLVEVGRETTDLPLLDDGVSRVHFRLRRERGQAFLDDLGSMNGTWVNRVLVSGSIELKAGDVIEVGASRLLVMRLADEPEAKAAVLPPVSRGTSVGAAAFWFLLGVVFGGGAVAIVLLTMSSE